MAAVNYAVKLTLCFAIWFVCTTTAKGQLMPLFSSYMQSFNSDRMWYDYRIELSDLKKGVVTDSIVGRLYRDKNKYLDSSSVGIAAMNGIYYCKIDYVYKTAIVYNLKDLQQRLHLELDSGPNPVINIEDSILLKYGRLHLDTSDKQFYTVRLQLNRQSISGMTIKISKVSKQVKEIIIQSVEDDPAEEGNDKNQFRKTFTIYNIHYTISADALDLRDIFTDQNGRVVLKGKYAGYKLKTLNR